ncbi:MAG: hypothetical protein LUI10_01020 [Lachnospiraceae bacterium]|nr:hypothetical protein [Lachnospiraceae bacterium]
MNELLHIQKHIDRLEAADQDTVMICTEIEVEGIGDYHGRKEKLVYLVN